MKYVQYSIYVTTLEEHNLNFCDYFYDYNYYNKVAKTLKVCRTFLFTWYFILE